MEQRGQVYNARVTKRVRLSYLLGLPDGYTTDTGQRASAGRLYEWPLIVYLHGSGERGDDLEALKRHGIPRIVAEGPPLNPFPFITVAPQCPDDTYWWDHIDTLRGLIATMQDEYAIDPARIYLTGNSMGGFGTWEWAAADPTRFAAIVPICGGGDPMHGFPNRVCTLVETPVWAFHGALDTNVPLSDSAIMVKTLRECGGDVRFTVYPFAEHDSWTETYNNPELYTWLLRHARGEPSRET